MNYKNNYDKINQGSKIKKTNDDEFFEIIKKEQQKQKTIFAGNNIDYSKNKRYEREKITPSQDTMNVQKKLNEYGFTDSEGKKLKVDGVYGPKTDTAFNKAYNANKHVFENREKILKQKEIEDIVNKAYDKLIRNAEKRKIDMPKSDIVKTKRILNQNGYTDMHDNPLEENDVWDDKTKIAFEKYVLDGIPSREILELQKILNKNGIADKDGNSLLEDGKFGKKTYGAVHNAVRMLGGNLDTEIKRGDSKKNTHIKDISGKGVNKQWSVGDKSVVPDKPSGMNIYNPIAETLLLDIRDGKKDFGFTKYSNENNSTEVKVSPLLKKETPADPLGAFQQRVGEELSEKYGLDKNNSGYVNNAESLDGYFSNKKYSDIDITGVQKVLNAKADINLGIDGIIGVNTYSAIAKYAKENGLTLEQASDRLVELGRTYNEIEALGLSGEEIKTIQTNLNQLGITDLNGNALDVDPYLGEFTVSAIDKVSNKYEITKKEAIDILLNKQLNMSEDASAISNVYDKICIDAENAYKLGIITKEEKDILLQDTMQKHFEFKANGLSSKDNNTFVDTCENILEYGIFDFLLGDVSMGTAYAPSEADYIKQKLYGNEENYEKLLLAGLAVQATSKGKDLEIVKINKQIWHVDIEYPQGNKVPNVHVQLKGTKYKEMIKSLDDLDKLPKAVRKNKKIIKAVQRALKIMSKF